MLAAVPGGDENLECIKVLYDYGADINYTEKYGHNLFHIAAIFFNNEIFEFLIKNASPGLLNFRNNGGETPSEMCKIRGNHAGVFIL